ncbi:MAG: PEGA domain-containing protein [Phycisphaerales bacterium]
MSPRPTLALGLTALALSLGGCIERTIRVTTEPPGARVWINDVEVGRSPVETAFTFYGDYDIQLQLDGYEPVQTCRHAAAPVHEWPGIDLVAEAIPHRFQNRIEWHFELQPEPESVTSPDEFDAELISRAKELEAQLNGETPEGAPSEQD